MNHPDRGLRRIACAALLTLSVAATALAAPTPPPAPPTDSQREAADVLRRMSDHLAALPAFTVNFRAGYDVVQASGQKIEFGEMRSVALARPDRLRVEEITSDGRHDLAVFDGKTMSVYGADRQVFAQAPQPGPVDDALVYFVRDLKMRMPLALLLTTRLPAELPDRVATIDYVERSEILGQPVDHVAGRTDSVDFQFWITQGEHPVPLRIVITYRDAPGQPQFWANLADWNTSPAFTRETFDFKPPAGAHRIDFAVQARGLSPATGAEVQP